MKLKFENDKNGHWHSGVYRGNGGISSLICARHSKSWWQAFKLFFNLRVYYDALTR